MLVSQHVQGGVVILFWHQGLKKLLRLRLRPLHFICAEDRGSSRLVTGSSKYSGLRNQDCTCYMNSVLQQLFMMPELRQSICSATLPEALRLSGVGMITKSADLVGKSILVSWDSGVLYDAVKSYNRKTGMHTIRYTPLQVSTARK